MDAWAHKVTSGDMNAACLFVSRQIIFALLQFTTRNANEMSSLFQPKFNFVFRVEVNADFVFSFSIDVGGFFLHKTRVRFGVNFFGE